MNSSTSTRGNNVSEVSGADIALPLAAVISLAITSYVIVVLVGEYRLLFKFLAYHVGRLIGFTLCTGIALRKWLFRMCCSSSDSTTDCFCDIGSNCFAFDSTGACCGNSGINCCSSSPVMNCCNAVLKLFLHFGKSQMYLILIGLC